MMQVSVILVTYNSTAHLPACLESLAGTGAELIVVDNASADDSAKIARAHGARVIANTANRGFAAACNQGAAAASGESLLFLNPDTVLTGGFDELSRALQSDPRAGAVGGALVDERGQPQRGFTFRRLPTFASLAFEVLGVNSVWPRNPVNRRYRCLDAPLDQPGEVQQPAGACLMVRRSALDAVRGWDERFFPLWFEDVDLCLRLRQAGYHLLYEPASRWFHRGGHSMARLTFAEKQYFWYFCLLCFVRKHMGFAAALVLRPLVIAGATARLAAGFLSRGRRHSLGAYWAVLRLALTGLRPPAPPVNH